MYKRAHKKSARARDVHHRVGFLANREVRKRPVRIERAKQDHYYKSGTFFYGIFSCASMLCVNVSGHNFRFERRADCTNLLTWTNTCTIYDSISLNTLRLVYFITS